MLSVKCQVATPFNCQMIRSSHKSRPDVPWSLKATNLPEQGHNFLIIYNNTVLFKNWTSNVPSEVNQSCSWHKQASMPSRPSQVSFFNIPCSQAVHNINANTDCLSYWRKTDVMSMLLAVVKSEQPNSCCLSMSKLALNRSDELELDAPPEVSELRLRGKRVTDLILLFQEFVLQCTMSQDKIISQSNCQCQQVTTTSVKKAREIGQRVLLLKNLDPESKVDNTSQVTVWLIFVNVNVHKWSWPKVLTTQNYYRVQLFKQPKGFKVTQLICSTF